MTTENLAKAKQLESDITHLQNNLQSWESAEGIRDQIALSKRYANGSRTFDWINNDMIDFDLLKLVTIASIQKKLQAAQTEFDSL